MVGKKLESEIQKEILSWLKKNGYKAWKNYLGPLFIQGGRHAKNPNSGQPDIFGIFKNHPGRLFAVEIKSAIGKISEDQNCEIQELEKAGVYVIATRDLETMKTLIEGIENGK